MRIVLKYLRRVTFGIIGLGLVLGGILGIGRMGVWLSTQDMRAGLSAAPQVFIWNTKLPNFGGYSGLIMGADGSTLLTSSDRGHMVETAVTRAPDGAITALPAPRYTRLLSHLGGETIAFHSDLEGLAPLPDGQIALAFESYTRLQIMPVADANGDRRPVSTHNWDTFKDLFGNQAFEAITSLPDGTLMAITERTVASAATDTYLYDGTTWQGPQPFAITPGFSVSGADLGPDGCLYILERRYGAFIGFQFQLRRLNPNRRDQAGTIVYRSKPMSLGNGEGLSVWKRDDQTLVASVITDNGFPPLQPTRLIELPLAQDPARDCADQ